MLREPRFRENNEVVDLTIIFPSPKMRQYSFKLVPMKLVDIVVGHKGTGTKALAAEAGHGVAAIPLFGQHLNFLKAAPSFSESGRQ